MKTINMDDYKDHAVCELICVKCYHRYVGVYPVGTKLKDLECETCGCGYIIKTGEDTKELTMKCKICKEEIDINSVAYGNMHINCAEKEITVYKVYDIDAVNGNFYVEKDIKELMKTIETLQDYDDGGGFGIRCATMTQGEYYNLPEFEGF